MVQVLNEKNFIRMPWKNGGGETLELYKVEHDSKIVFRLSIATVKSSGPFSHFPDLARYLTLIKGQGFVLNFDHKSEILNNPLDWIKFDGNDNIHCELINGECLDFNVMIAKNQGAVITRGFKAENKTFWKFKNLYPVAFIFHHRLQTLYKLETNEEITLDLWPEDLIIEISKETALE